MAAERYHVAPWELDPTDGDDVPARLQWRARMLMFMQCESERHQRQESTARSRERIGRVRSGRGRFQRGGH